jgi:RNA polymerase subunit RPABC4/transcription elongation factor Spt4
MPCLGLGLDLLNLAQIKAPDAVQRSSEREGTGAQVRCPECAWEITQEFTWCPQCGLRMKPYQCVYCRSWVPVGLDACPHCGAPEA